MDVVCSKIKGERYRRRKRQEGKDFYSFFQEKKIELRGGRKKC